MVLHEKFLWDFEKDILSSEEILILFEQLKTVGDASKEPRAVVPSFNRGNATFWYDWLTPHSVNGFLLWPQPDVTVKCCALQWECSLCLGIIDGLWIFRGVENFSRSQRWQSEDKFYRRPNISRNIREEKVNVTCKILNFIITASDFVTVSVTLTTPFISLRAMKREMKRTKASGKRERSERENLQSHDADRSTGIASKEAGSRKQFIKLPIECECTPFSVLNFCPCKAGKNAQHVWGIENQTETSI